MNFFDSQPSVSYHIMTTCLITFVTSSFSCSYNLIFEYVQAKTFLLNTILKTNFTFIQKFIHPSILYHMVHYNEKKWFIMGLILKTGLVLSWCCSVVLGCTRIALHLHSFALICTSSQY